jgi:acyl-CoA synthetase (AMP-forming)/AMP-acid ligase II
MERHSLLLIRAGAAMHLTYRRLRIDALAVAAGLTDKGYGGGDAVAIMLPTGSDFFAAFYGALCAGCVPVPLYPPARRSQLEDHLRRIAGILRNAEARVLITFGQAKPLAHLLRAQIESLRAVTTPIALLRAIAPCADCRRDRVRSTPGSTGVRRCGSITQPARERVRWGHGASAVPILRRSCRCI